MEQVINKLKAELLKTLPGQDIQYQMAPAGRARYNPSEAETLNYRQSAVMVLFCLDSEGDWFVPLTLRFSYKGAHSGQISLPGGKYEETDLSLQATALRECFEEIGVRDNLEVLGKLTKLHIPVSAYVVEPFIGICKTRDPLFTPHEREVKSIIRLRVADLVDSATISNGTIEIEGNSGMKIQTPYFRIGDYKVWGATAMILNELKEIIRPIF